MTNLLNFPVLLGLVTLPAMWLATRIGVFLRRRRKNLEAIREDFGIVLGASLTLLGLIIGFSFSMATSRYDQRKNLEAEEANAIGTEYLRADLLPPADAAKVRSLLREYVQDRRSFYQLTNPGTAQLREINTATVRLQNQLWAAITFATATRATPVNTLAVSGVNEVLNSQGYTQAAWWNRIPLAAWIFMLSIAAFCNLLIGYGAHHTRSWLLLVLPLLVSISFVLIADIDSPRGGLIRVQPRNLISLAESLQAQ
jgi:hypothetical protein